MGLDRPHRLGSHCADICPEVNYLCTLNYQLYRFRTGSGFFFIFTHMKKLFSEEQFRELIDSLVEGITKKYPRAQDLIFIGIQQGGVVVANQIVKNIQAQYPREKIQYGQLDITFYRDDIRKEILVPDKMNLPFDIENKTVILIDDVLFTGRTIKAALDSLLDYGRPSKVELCVLIDRKEHRQLPIQPDYAGRAVETRKTDKVKLVNGEVVLLSGD